MNSTRGSGPTISSFQKEQTGRLKEYIKGFNSNKSYSVFIKQMWVCM